MSWLSPLIGSTTAQRDAATRVYLMAKEAGRVRECSWEPRNLEDRSQAKPRVFSKPAPKKVGERFSPKGRERLRDMAFKMKKDGLLTTKEIADTLDLNPRTIRKWFSGK